MTALCLLLLAGVVLIAVACADSWDERRRDDLDRATDQALDVANGGDR